ISNTKSVAGLKLWGIALNRLKINRNTGITYSILLKEDIEKVNASEDEVSGLTNLINTTPESRIALLLYETRDGKIKGSLRTESDEIDLSKLARELGGGGLKKAAGFSLNGRIEKRGDGWKII
ncbi:MAG: DHHA1 domain-containing protein, partial [Candidatus Curtissbacteria bacterium]|nr:DHHA1 domain-containing protein [Candidatus Curtissbacteria bacterium]